MTNIHLGRWTLVVFALLAVSAFSLNAGAWDRAESRTGNFCKDQYENFLWNHFGPDFEFLEVTKVKIPGNGGHYEFWIKSNFCNNYFIATTIPKATCSIAHYGRVPVYVNRVWARGDCREHMPRDVYPNRSTTREPDWLRD